MTIRSLVIGVVLGVLISLAVSAQPLNKQQAVKFHVAQKLLSRDWSAMQKEFILRTMNDPQKSQEFEALGLFTQSEAMDLFGDIGNTDISAFKTTFALTDLTEKKRFVNRSPDRAGIWATWFAYDIVTHERTLEQQELFIQIASLMRTPNLKRAKGLESRALELFPNDKNIFANIGPSLCSQRSVFIPARLTVFGKCNCSNGSSFNASCSDTCSGGTGCTSNDDGCGFLWLYVCDGGCTPKHAEVIDGGQDT